MKNGKVALIKSHFPAGQLWLFSRDGEIGVLILVARQQVRKEQTSFPKEIKWSSTPVCTQRATAWKTSNNNNFCTDQITLKNLKKEKFCSPQTTSWDQLDHHFFFLYMTLGTCFVSLLVLFLLLFYGLVWVFLFFCCCCFFNIFAYFETIDF